MPIKLLACDLDGTLANHNGYISPESMAALARARSEGVLFVLATGRMPMVLGDFLDRLNVTGEPIIAGQGALVLHRDGRVLRRLTVDAAVAREAAELARRFDAGMAYYTEHSIVVDRFVFPAEKYTLWFGKSARIDPQATERLNGDLIKFMAVHPDLEVVPQILSTWREHLGRRADVTRSWHWFVEGAAPGADKGSALTWLCQRMGIDREEVLALGDNGNDVTMLRWAGQSAAPADGDPAAIAAAAWAAPPLPEHPVAAALAHFLKW